MPKTRKMLSSWEAPYIQVLIKLIETQSKVTLVSWAVDYAERVLLPIWVKHSPDDLCPQNALTAARRWMAGDIKLPQAKAAILRCHEAAREAEESPAAQAAARAIGQAAAAIHSPRHCMGIPLYGALAAAYDSLGADASWTLLEQYAAGECGRMLEALHAVAVEDEPNPAKIVWRC